MMELTPASITSGFVMISEETEVAFNYSQKSSIIDVW